MNDLIKNIDKLHTTELGVIRIKKNLKIDVDDVVEYLKNKILDNSYIHKNSSLLATKITVLLYR